MSNRNIEEKDNLIEFLQQKGVDINAKGPVGETVYEICPSLNESSRRRPETTIRKSEFSYLLHSQATKDDPYSRSI